MTILTDSIKLIQEVVEQKIAAAPTSLLKNDLSDLNTALVAFLHKYDRRPKKITIINEAL